MEKTLQMILEKSDSCLICSSEDLENGFSSNTLLWLSGDDEDFMTLGDLLSYLMKKEKQYYANMILCGECTKNAITSYKFMQQCESKEKTMTKLLIGLKNITEMTEAGLTNQDKVSFMQVDTVKGRFNAFCDTQVTQSLSLTLDRFNSILKSMSVQIKKEEDSTSDDDSSSKSSSDYDPSNDDGNYSDSKYAKIVVTCPICSRKFRGKTNLNYHIDATHRPKVFECDICNRKFGSSRLATVHKRKSHLKQPCHICGKMFARSQHMLDHIESHTMTLQCEKCMRKFSTNMSLLRHQRRDYCNKPMKERQNVDCPECESKFSCKISLKNHIEFKHRGIARFICEICSAKCQTKTQLDRHVENCHTNHRARYHCSQCDKVFLTKSYLNAHIRMAHTGERNTICYYCPEKFFSSNDRTRHIESKHKEKTFSCETCNSKFVSRQRLRRHQMSKRCKGIKKSNE